MITILYLVCALSVMSTTLTNPTPETKSLDDQWLNKNIERFVNHFRSQSHVKNIRKLYKSADLYRMAKDKAMRCDASEVNTGPYGVLVFNMRENEPVESLGKAPHFQGLFVYNRNDGSCLANDNETICHKKIQIHEPTAWKIGCAAHACPDGNLVICYMNRRTQLQQIPFNRDDYQCTNSCTESFQCKGYLCELKKPPSDESEIGPLPEDGTESPVIAASQGSKAVARTCGYPLFLSQVALLSYLVLQVFI